MKKGQQTMEEKIMDIKNEKAKRLIELGEKIYNEAHNTEAVMFLAYAMGLADANSKEKSA